MENKNLLFQIEDIKVLNELLENLNVVLKDSDAVAEKEIVKQFLREISDVITIAILGNKGVGKTSLLNSIFNEDLGSSSSTKEICEYRYGAKDNAFQLDTKVTRYFKTKETLQGIAIVDMPGCDVWNRYEIEKVAIEYLNKSDVIISVFRADSVNAYDVWEVLEKIDNKKIVFALNKSDCVSEKILNEAELRLRQYMLEAGIHAPIFKISLLPEEKGEMGEITALCNYINVDVIGQNTILKKQQNNMLAVKEVLKEVERSFALRKKQFELDCVVLDNISRGMDVFYKRSDEKIEQLKSKISIQIDKEIEAYQNEIIQRLNPKKIRERFQNGSDDFTEYLELVNENYRNRMTNEINKITQSYIRTYLCELENVFKESIGYFQTRESILNLEDKIYGTLANNKRVMVEDVSSQLVETHKLYHSLNEAADELFIKVWEAREKYEENVAGWENGGKILGVVGGGFGSKMILGTKSLAGYTVFETTKNAIIPVVANAFKLAVDSAFVTSAAGLISGGLCVAIAAVVLLGSGIVLQKISKDIGIYINSKQLEKKVNGYIEEFKEEVENTKIKMKEQILYLLEDVLTKELRNVDQAFVDFRMSVNIDSKNIPLIEERLHTVHELMEKVNQMEKEIELIC